MAVDKHNNEIPWYTYASIIFLTGRIKKDFSVFEYGSGNSTIWFGENAGKVVAVEHDEDWYKKMRKIIAETKNVTYSHCELKGSKYVDEIFKYENEFDMIVIDGRERVECSKNVLKPLKKGGVIIWDNSDRTEYQEGYDYLFKNGFRKIDFWGIGPINDYEWCTSIFYRDNNCLGI
jgi:predicted O-methyltransferase YrrM